MIISYKDFLKTNPRQMKGLILVENDEQPIEKALISFANGEGVALSDACGCFSLKTWSGLPVEIVIEHLDYETARFRWEKCSEPIRIRLIKKISACTGTI